MSLLYHPPGQCVDVFSVLQQYYALIHIAQYSSFVLLGDFNVNIVNLCSILTMFLSLFGLTQVDHPTHLCNGNLNSLIDLVFVSNPLSLSYCKVIPPLSNSDHLGIKLELQLKGPSRGVKYHTSRLVWNYAEADWERGCQLIRVFDWNTLLSNDINAAWINWHHMFINIMDKVIPQVILSPRRNLPWMSAAIIKAIKKRDSFFKKEGVTPRFKSARNRVTSLLRKAKRQYFHRIKPSEPKKFWKFVKALSKNRSSIPALKFNDILYESDEQKAAVLNSFFSSCFNLSHPPLDPSFPEDHLSVPNCEALYCTTEEVMHMLEHLDCSKACGPDQISARMLKVTASSIAPSITKLFNISIRTGKLPDQWKLSMVVPIPKSSNLSEPSNYRPISLLCILGKLLEKHISNLILESLENSSFDLSAQQWGFRSGRSTVSALLSVTHDWHAKARKHVLFSSIIRKPLTVFPIDLFFQNWNLYN